MATLKIQLPGKGTRVYRIHKKITSLGRSADADVSRAEPSVAESHAHIHFDGREFNLHAADREGELYVNGRKRSKQRLVHEDRTRRGAADLDSPLYNQRGPDDPADTGIATELASYKKLYEFSGKLMASYELPALLDQLLDVMIQVSNADKGFLVLMESGEPVVKVARNLRRETIFDAVRQLSDSILAHVIKTRRPLIISDALRDEEFKNSLSVVNLKLTSVMCVPLIEQGNMLGVIYVGNDSVAELFAESHLEVMSVFAAQASLLVRNALLVNDLRLDNRSLQSRIEQIRFGEILGASPRMQEVFRKVQKVAATDISVLITGETGTGKELIARELHSRSPRAKHPFITINCGAIPENLLESELFSHVRGAFTGAVGNKVGRFQSADHGTLFLDEIGEMPLALQVKILRALQRRWSFGWATPAPRPSTSGSWPPPTGTWTSKSRPAASARISTTDSTWFTCTCRRCATAATTSRSWPVTWWAATRPNTAARSAGSPPTRSRPSSATAGRATSGSSRTGSRRRWCWPTRRSSDRRIWICRPTISRPSCRWPTPRRNFSASTSTRSWRSTAATAPRPPGTWASTRARSSATSRRAKATDLSTTTRPRWAAAPERFDAGAPWPGNEFSCRSRRWLTAMSDPGRRAGWKPGSACGLRAWHTYCCCLLLSFAPPQLPSPSS